MLKHLSDTLAGLCGALDVLHGTDPLLDFLALCMLVSSCFTSGSPCTVCPVCYQAAGRIVLELCLVPAACCRLRSNWWEIRIVPAHW
jgi:hypothetical protein